MSASDGDRRLELVYSVGEASGDAHAAALHAAMAQLAPDGLQVTGSGIAGSKMKECGIAVVADASGWGSMGIAEAIRLMPAYRAGMRRIKAHLAGIKQRRIALILIDFGYFNVRLAAWARRQGIGPIIYYMPPGSWKRHVRAEKLYKFVQLCDLIITPFRWSDEKLKSAGGNSYWLGHPLIDHAAIQVSPQEFDREHGLGESQHVVALLPGSRMAEIAHILPKILQAAQIVAERVRGVGFVIPASSRRNRVLIESVIAKSGCALRPVVVENATSETLARCDFAIITSGTATLEAAVLARPMAIVYGGSRIIELEYKLRRRSLNIAHMGLPNIIAGERIVPEIIFLDGEGAEEVAEVAVAHLTDPERSARTQELLRERVIPALGEPGVVRRAAATIWEFLRISGDAA